MITLTVLRAVSNVFHCFVIKVIRSPCFVGQNITAVPFVLKDRKDRTRTPYLISFFCRPFQLCKRVCDGLRGITE